METASTSTERTPLLGDFRIDISPDEQTSLNGNTFKDKRPLEGNCTTSNEQTPHIGQDSSNNCSDERNEVSLEEIVRVMCSAWRHHRQPRDRAKDYRHSKETRMYSVFTVRELYAMRLAWQKHVQGRKCSVPPHQIGEAVATAIAKELLQVPECDERDLDADFQMQFAIKKNLLASDFLQAWFTFVDEINEVLYFFPIRYVETMFRDHIEEPPVGFTFWPRVVKLYDTVHDFFMKPKLQLLLHNLLFIWPLVFFIIGSKYMDCPMGHHLSILMILVGCLGGFTILYRLGLMYLFQGHYIYDHFWRWKFLTWTELTFLVMFYIQFFHFFYIDLTTEPDSNQCVKDFYSAARVINYVTIPLACVYVFAYSIITCSNVFDCWIWAVRRF